MDSTHDLGEEQPENSEEPQDGQPADVGRHWTAVGFLFIAAALAAVGLLAYRAYPSHQPKKTDPSFVDVIFGNNLVVFAARVVLFATAVVLAVTAFYVVYSMVVRIRRGHLLSQFGPLRVQEVQDLSDEVEFWQNSWAEADSENDILRARLIQTEALLQELVEEGAQDQERGDEPEEEAPS